MLPGDAKCVLARISDKRNEQKQLRPIVLTREHKALFPAERDRILRAKGSVSKDGRLEGRFLHSLHD